MLNGIEISCDDVIHNFTTRESQTMNGSVPWRGPREKDPFFYEILIAGCSKPGAVILDCSAATGKHIYFIFHAFSHVQYIL